MDSVLVVKVVSALLYPLGLFFVMHLFAWICRRQSAARVLWLVAAWGILLLSSNPMVATTLVKNLEQKYPQSEISQIVKHDAIVVLGGGLRIPLPPAKSTQLSSGSDRYWHAAKLYKAGKAERILLTGGNVFAQIGFAGEAFYAAELLQNWGVPRGVIQAESLSRTTEENSLNIAEWIQAYGVQRVLLVTSAYHMPRALEAFKDLHIQVTPASADILIRETARPTILNWLPSASALSLTTLAVHEYLGMVFLDLKKRLNLA